MQRSFRRVVLTAAMLSATLGCHRSVVQQNKQPPDPLLVSKKPVEGKPTSNPRPDMAARVDPQPPPFPESDATYTAGTRGVPGQLSSEMVVQPGR